MIKFILNLGPILVNNLTLDLKQIATDFLANGTYFGLLLIKAIIIFIVGKLLIRLINKILHKFFDKYSIDESVKSFFISFINLFLILLLAISIIGVLGIPTTSFAAMLASMGLAIGMALSGNLSNFAGGLIILIFRPFKVGDFITTSTVQGKVIKIEVFHTILISTENVRIYVPNGNLSSGFINNFNIQKRRIDLEFPVALDSDLALVFSNAMEVIKMNKKILTDPKPAVEVKKITSSELVIIARIWAYQYDSDEAIFSLNREIYLRFAEKNIQFNKKK